MISREVVAFDFQNKKVNINAFCESGHFHGGVVEDSVLLGCDDASLGA